MSAPRKPTDKRRWIWLKERRSGRPLKLRRRPVIFAPLPTILTLANGLCGLSSAAIATGTILNLPRNEAVFYAGLLIFCGMFFDMLDGQAARWLKQSSNFGEQMDSLCDVITFGVAPVFILLTYSHLLPVRLTFGIGAIYISCVLLRLARFNAEKSHSDTHEFFSGLPSPAAAGIVASFAVALPGVEQLTDESMNEWVRSASSRLVDAAMVALPLLTFVGALLMVSRFRYSHVVNRWIRRKYRYHDLTRIILVVVAGVTIHELMLPLLFCSFAFEPPLAGIWNGLTRPFRKDPPETGDPNEEGTGDVGNLRYDAAE
ncbi:MAG: CDP-alcohol phosphatidyltransferase family protein [Planctomycetales bacterium]|nr:CDP-alcohol phosphatidyltransferase family protein [Planctomycetales bacterium]